MKSMADVAFIRKLIVSVIDGFDFRLANRKYDDGHEVSRYSFRGSLNPVHRSTY